jgi:hypothetical protein
MALSSHEREELESMKSSAELRGIFEEGKKLGQSEEETYFAYKADEEKMLLRRQYGRRIGMRYIRPYLRMMMRSEQADAFEDERLIDEMIAVVLCMKEDVCLYSDTQEKYIELLNTRKISSSYDMPYNVRQFIKRPGLEGRFPDSMIIHKWRRFAIMLAATVSEIMEEHKELYVPAPVILDATYTLVAEMMRDFQNDMMIRSVAREDQNSPVVLAYEEENAMYGKYSDYAEECLAPELRAIPYQRTFRLFKRFMLNEYVMLLAYMAGEHCRDSMTFIAYDRTKKDTFSTERDTPGYIRDFSEAVNGRGKYFFPSDVTGSEWKRLALVFSARLWSVLELRDDNPIAPGALMRYGQYFVRRIASEFSNSRIIDSILRIMPGDGVTEEEFAAGRKYLLEFLDIFPVVRSFDRVYLGIVGTVMYVKGSECFEDDFIETDRGSLSADEHKRYIIRGFALLCSHCTDSELFDEAVADFAREAVGSDRFPEGLRSVSWKRTAILAADYIWSCIDEHDRHYTELHDVLKFTLNMVREMAFDLDNKRMTEEIERELPEGPEIA